MFHRNLPSETFATSHIQTVAAKKEKRNKKEVQMNGIKQLIKEIIPVIIGILIALFINNWNDERKEKQYLNTIFSSIESELKESVSDIETVVPKQLASVDTIQTYLDNDEVSLYDIILKMDGIHTPTIKMNSWNAIANSKIELIDYERLSALADIEERKNNLMERIEKQVDFTFQNFEETNRRKKEILNMMILDVIGAEKRLQSAIEELIKK